MNGLEIPQSVDDDQRISSCEARQIQTQISTGHKKTLQPNQVTGDFM